jgi:hypothetical protein
MPLRANRMRSVRYAAPVAWGEQHQQGASGYGGRRHNESQHEQVIKRALDHDRSSSESVSVDSSRKSQAMSL